MTARINIPAGTQFGHWTTTGNSQKVIRRMLWECVCGCGVVRMVSLSNLRNGHSKSCGCQQKQNARATYEAHPGNWHTPRRGVGGRSTHGMSSSPEYEAWSAMKKRCGNSRLRGFKNYGGRGITVCEKWRNSFQAFYRDMGPRPSKKHSIERRNNDLGYEPSNCYWATRVEQNRNTRSNKLATFNGETHCLAEWADRVGVAVERLYYRLDHGWPIEKAFTVPANKLNRLEKI